MTANEVLALINSGMFEYGSEVNIYDLATIAEITVPGINTMSGEEAVRAARTFELQLVGVYDTINQQLLGMGRKLTRRGDMYVVPTVGETLKYVEQYHNQGNNKQSKALKLYRSFAILHPTEIADENHIAQRLNIARNNQANRFRDDT